MFGKTVVFAFGQHQMVKDGDAWELNCLLVESEDGLSGLESDCPGMSALSANQTVFSGAPPRIDEADLRIDWPCSRGRV